MLDISEEKARLKRKLSEEAINLAMQGRWKEAVVVNQNIIDENPTDVDSYNRLGKAQTELGEFAKAREAYNRALELVPYNIIAQKNLARLAQLENLQVAIKNDRSKVSPDFFIGELGKTGEVNLEQLGSEAVLAKMSARDQVYLKLKGHTVVVENEQGEPLGNVEPQHGNRLARLMEGGNKYTAAIKSVDTNKVMVFVRESSQHPDVAGKLSFPHRTTDGFLPHVKDAVLRQGEIDEDYEEDVDLEEGEEEGESLPEGFSILEAGVPIEDIVEEDLLEEE